MKILGKILFCLFLATASSAFLFGADIPAEYTVVDQNDILALLYNDENAEVAVMDKRNGEMWSSLYRHDGPSEELGKQWSARTGSLIDLFSAKPNDDNFYFSTEKNEETVYNVTVDKGVLYITLDFTELGLIIPLRFSIEGNSLDASILEEGLEEYGDQKLIMVSLLPFFGAASDREEGYAFYPDGSGAIHRFSENHGEYVHNYSATVYGDSILDMESGRSGDEQAYLPVFGMKRGESAYLAVAAEGDSDMKVDFSPGGYRIPVNRINGSFIYRHKYKIKRSNVIARTTQALTTIVEIIDEKMVEGDRTMRYFFLDEDNADYSGMAVQYRDYLLDENKIQRTVDDGDTPLYLSLLMAIKEIRILSDKMISMTSYEEASEIVRLLEENGVDRMSVNLLGWDKVGYYINPQKPAANRKIGGFRGLKSFAELLEEKEHTLNLFWDPVRAYKSDGGFSVYNDTVKNPLGLVVTNAMGEKFLQSPIKSSEVITDELIPYLGDLPLNGLTLERIGELLIMDSVDGERIMRSDSMKIWQDVAVSSEDAFEGSVTSSGNAYMLAHADHIQSLPFKDTGFFFSDSAVPFYQMAVHGLVNYTTDIPGNLAWDHQWMKLKWIEYGYLPYYQLTYEDSGLLQDTYYTALYNSKYMNWLSTASEVYSDFNENLSGLNGSMMIEHEMLSDHLNRVTYDNGTAVIVNYGNEPALIDDIRVGAMDYAVISGKGAY